jgi:hypothetical protein
VPGSFRPLSGSTTRPGRLGCFLHCPSWSLALQCRSMTNAKLADELHAISRELEEVLANERAAAIELDRRFAEDLGAIKALLHSVQEAKAAARWRNNRFNVFDILRRPRLEQAHSGFLAWLLDPSEAHGLGDTFLRQFMRQAIGREPPATGDIAVCTEFSYGGGLFDIYVEGPRWRLIVENKIDDSPWEGQCEEYQAHCDQLMACGQQAWLVYVTPHAGRPEKWICHWISYREVRLILESLTPDPSTAPLIDQFCEHILSEFEAR